MFQATEIMEDRQRPAIMHAKAEMERSLASIAAEEWIPMAAVMLGTAGKPPMWVTFESFLKGKNCLCSRTGNSGTLLGPRLCSVPIACWN